MSNNPNERISGEESSAKNRVRPTGDDRTKTILLRRYGGSCLVCRAHNHTHLYCPHRPCYLCGQKGHFASDCQFRLRPGAYHSTNRAISKDGVSMYNFIRRRPFESTSNVIYPRQVRFPNPYRDSRIAFIGRTMHSKRITSAEWHPTGQHILTGDKSGEVRLWSLNDAAHENSLVNVSHKITVNQVSHMFHCNVHSFVFHPFRDDITFASSLDGTILGLSLNYDTTNTKKTSSTSSASRQSVYRSYFQMHLNTSETPHTSSKFLMPYGMKMDKDHHCLYVGVSNGSIMRVDPREDSKVMTNMLFHKNKVTCIDVNPMKSDLITSASNDRYVKLWDARKFHPKHHIGEFAHKRVVSSAYFSPQTGSKLLTTSLDNMIRIWNDLNVLQWDINDHPEGKPIEIVHSHNFHRHLNAFKAVWDPNDIREDIIVCGRYLGDAYAGDEEDSEAILHPIDLLSANSGELIHSLVDPSFTLIQPIAKVAPKANFIMSAASQHVVLWSPPNMNRKTKRRRSPGPGGNGHDKVDDDDDEDDDDDDDDDSQKKKLRKVTILSVKGTTMQSRKAKEKI